MDHPEIRLAFPKSYPPEYSVISDAMKDVLCSRYHGMINNLHEGKIWDENISAVVFAVDMSATLQEYNELWNANHTLTREKEYFAASKSISRYQNEEIEHVIILPGHIFLSKEQIENYLLDIDNLFLFQAITIFSKNILPDNLNNEISGLAPFTDTNIEKVIEILLATWCSQLFTKQLYERATKKTLSAPSHHSQYVITFKRNLKKILYESQSDEEVADDRWYNLWKKYVGIFSSLIHRLIDEKTDNQSLHIADEKEAKILYGIVGEIERNLELLKQDKAIDTFKTKHFFQDFARLFNIHIFQREEPHNINFTFYTNPKELFKNEIIETEQRIVAFVDILGFSKMIADYDNDPSSSLLQDIQKIFNKSVEDTFRKFNQNVKGSFLEYKLFSDNLCVSVPFYDSKEDFTAQFQFLTHMVRSYQMAMMEKGYYVRGGITIGSYYSDDKMIFSGGLVRAYHLESKVAKYPRIVIDNNVIDRLRVSYTNEKYFVKGNRHLIIHADEDDQYFLNPYLNVKDILSNSTPILEELFASDNEDEKLNSLMATLRESVSSLLNTPGVALDEQETISTQVNTVQTVLNENVKRLDPKNEAEPLRKLQWLTTFNDWYKDKSLPGFKPFAPEN